MNQKVNRRRSNSITIRFDNDEKREWLKYCDSLNEPQFGSYADVILHLIRSNTTIHIDLNSLRDNTIALNKIGANLNQIAKACNSGKQLDAGSYMYFKEALNVLKINKDSLNKSIVFFNLFNIYFYHIKYAKNPLFMGFFLILPLRILFINVINCSLLI